MHSPAGGGRLHTGRVVNLPRGDPEGRVPTPPIAAVRHLDEPAEVLVLDGGLWTRAWLRMWMRDESGWWGWAEWYGFASHTFQWVPAERLRPSRQG